jgi:DNA polymerase III subunit epsilon
MYAAMPSREPTGTNRICRVCAAHKCTAGEQLCSGCLNAWWESVLTKRVSGTRQYSPALQTRDLALDGLRIRSVRNDKRDLQAASSPPAAHDCKRCGRSPSSSLVASLCGRCYVLTTFDRLAATVWARSLLRSAGRWGWLIIDTETTGIDQAAEIVEIGILAPSGTVLLNTLVRPRCRIPAAATAIHQITDALVAEARTFPEVYDQLVGLMRGRWMVAYNAAFDARILHQGCRRYQLPPVGEAGWQCVMLQYARYVGEWDANRHAYRWQRLAGAGGDHTAIGDCRATLGLLRDMAADGSPAT